MAHIVLWYPVLYGIGLLFSKVQACSWNDNRFWLDISAAAEIEEGGGKRGFGSVSSNRALIPGP